MSTRFISINPGLQFGTPCLDGTRLPAEQMAMTYLYHGEGEVYRGWPDTMDREALLVCCWYVATYGGTRYSRGRVGWRKRWKDWAETDAVFHALWASDPDWEAVPLPPRERDGAGR